MAQPQTYGTPQQTDGPDTLDLTKEEGRQVKDQAKQQAGAVAGTAREQAGGVANEAMGHARDLTNNAKQQLHHQARQQTDALGGAIGTFGDRVQALAQGNVDEAGPVGDYAQRLAGQVDQLAGRVNELGFDGMMDQVQRYARRRPGAFLLGAAAAGFAASRLTRGAQSHQPSSGGSGSGPDTTTGRSFESSGSDPMGATRPMPANPGSSRAPATATGMTGGASVTEPPAPPMPTAPDPAMGAPAADDLGRNRR